MMELARIFDDIWLSAPDLDAEAYSVIWSEANLPRPPMAVTTAALCLNRGRHTYGHFMVDTVSIEADKPTLAQLGLLMLSSVLHRLESRVTVHLTHPRSKIRTLIIDPTHQHAGASHGLQVLAQSFHYVPAEVWKHPWQFKHLTPWELPVLSLTNEQEMLIHPQDFERREVVIGFGTMEGTCLLAELFMNASRPSNKQPEFALECESGYRGVGLGSVEMSIHLPGSLGNLDHEPALP